MGKFEEDFTLYMDAGVPIMYVDTLEDDKASESIHELCRKVNKGVMEWSLSDGLRDDTDHSTLPEYDLATMLEQVRISNSFLENKLLLLKDVHFFLEQKDIKAIAQLKRIAQGIIHGDYDCNICILAPLISLPKELENYTTVMNLDRLDSAEIEEIIQNFIEENGVPKPEKSLLDKLATQFKGLSRTAIDNILFLIVADDGVIDSSDLPVVAEQKQQMVRKSGILEMIEVREKMGDIGGLDNLISWLKRKADIFQRIEVAKNFGVDIPKGVLIAGMPGCGKSLTAKAAAKLFDMPLLRMDMGRLMGKYVGESEGNMRRAIQLTEASSPCVLWIDELEKAFAGIGGGGSEVTTRLFGNFLTWMQEKDSLAFVIATANKIDKLPPELLRKGRFDEIFYVDLPNKKERESILKIHIKKRLKRRNGISEADIKNKMEQINFGKLITETGGYCGADLEGVVKDGFEFAFANKQEDLSTDNILMAIKNTHPLSEIMKDDLDQMKKVYTERKFKNASAGE